MKKSSLSIEYGPKNKLSFGENPLIVLGICFFISFLYLLVCTKSSPIYPFNDWVDVNAFFTVGKGMMRGLVLYRDLFEQKGPLLYFIYGIASLISYKTFLGGFIFEVIAFTLFLFFSFKSMLLFMENKLALITLPFLAILILNIKAFTHGGSAEELSLPLLAFSLYYLLRLMKDDEGTTISGWLFFWNGLVAGCVLWIKFSMLGFWLGWILAYFVTLILRKKVLAAVRGVFIFLVGMLAATLPWLVYFGLNHAIGDWLNTYFVLNTTGYIGRLSFFESAVNLLSVLAAQFIMNPVFGVFFWFGNIAFLVFGKFVGMVRSRLLTAICFLLLLMGIYWGKIGYVYYFLLLTPFAIFGFIVIVDALKTGMAKFTSRRTVVILLAATLILSLPLEYRFNQNAYLLHLKQIDLVQYKFAEVINRSKDMTLLNYGFLDMGFYTTTGIIPNVKYFELQNLDYARYPMNLDEQQRYIKEGATNFVVLRGNPQKGDPSKSIPFLQLNYHLVATVDQPYEGHWFNYYLYELDPR